MPLSSWKKKLAKKFENQSTNKGIMLILNGFLCYMLIILNEGFVF